MPSAFDTIKMVLGGDPCPANVKYQGHSVISRTPVIMTGNNSIFPRGQKMWADRCFFEDWRSAPMLKSCIGYPDPRVYYELIMKYDIESIEINEDTIFYYTCLFIENRIVS